LVGDKIRPTFVIRRSRKEVYLVSDTDKLDRRLLEHRQRISDSRAGPGKSFDEALNDLYWGVAQDHPEAVARWSEIGEIGLVKSRKVTPAVAFGSGILSLDMALGGGIPAGSTEIYGKEGVGKTSLLIGMVRDAQERGLETALCPSEYFDGPYYEALGVDLQKLILIRGAGEDVLVEAARFVLQPCHALFVDSASGVRPENDQFANWRIMIGTWMAAIHSRIPVSSAVVMTNQVRAKRSMKPGKLFAGGYDSTAKKIASLFDTRLEVSRASVSDTKYDLVIDIVNNTLSRPMVLVTLPFVKGKGVDIWRDLVHVASVVGTLEQRGSWYYYEEVSVGQGEESVARLLEKNQDFAKILMDDTRHALSCRQEG
jgi:RecA/RadA recombinase